MKHRFLLLTAFALMALMAPLGAKGQQTQQQSQVPAHLTVAFARNFANLDWPVTFYGYVNYAYQLGSTGGWFYLQDNSSASDGRGLYVWYDDSFLSSPLNDEIRIGSFVKVTATKVIANQPNNLQSSGVAMVYYTNCTSIEVISQDNELMVVNASLQGLKAAHFPLASHLVSDAYQHRLVKLTNLKVVDEITNYNNIKSYVVQDATLVRDTLYGTNLQLEVGQSIASMVVVNTRTSYDKLLLRSLDDITIEHSLFQARHLAEANIPVCFSGVVTFRTKLSTDPATIYMQATDASNNTTGIVLYVHNCPVSVQAGYIITVSADKVSLDENGKNVYIADTDINDITVVGLDPNPRVRNMSLEGMKSTHYPATPQRIMNDIYQHTLVKVSNVRVVDLLENSWYRGCVIENANHTRDTISYYFSNSEPTLLVGQSLASVTAVNCRDSGTAFGGMMKLCLRSVDDIDFDIKSIRYARTHINQTHIVEGVVSLVKANEVYIQDNTGGLYISGPDFPDLAVGDRIRVLVHPEINYISIKCFDSHVIAVLGHDETLNPMVPDNIATLYQLDPNNPGPSFYEERKMKLQNTVVKSKTYYHNERLYIEVYQSGGDPNQTVMLYCYVPLFTANELDDLNSRINAGTLVPSATGVKTTAISTHYLTGITNIQIVEPHFISLSTYPSQLSGGTGMSVTLRADEYYSWELENQGAIPGTRIYLHANHSVANDYNMIDRFLNPLNAPYTGQCPNMELLRIDCTTHPDLQLTRVNEDCWSFIMPNEDVAFEGVYWPKKENGSLCEFSDVWEAREGATESLETAPLAYLRAIVTDVDEGWYHIQDAYNHNCNNDELKKYNGIRVHASSDGLQVGDNIYLCGYPHLYEWLDGTVVLSDVRVLRKGNYGYIEHAYPTTLAGIVEDYYGSGHSSAKDSRLQDRVVSLSNVYVQMVTDGYIYISQTTGDETKDAVVTLPENTTITEGSTISQMTVINMTDREDEGYYDAELILRSMDDMPGANEITLSTNRVEFNEFGGTVSVPINIGANIGGTPQLVTDSYNLNFTATMNANHTAIDITVPASNSTENGIGSIQITVGEISSELLAVVQTGCAPAAFELYPTYQVIDHNNTSWMSLRVNNIKHVATPYGDHMATPTVTAVDAPNNFGTDWITFGSWNENTQSFTFRCNSANTGSQPRGVKVEITFTGTDNTNTKRETYIYQNPPEVAMTLDPTDWNMGDTPKCVPVTQTITVYYENANDQSNYNADYVWLETRNLGPDFSEDFTVEPEYIAIDPSRTGAATFTVTYIPTHERHHDGMLYARIGEYDIVNHESIPGGAASPQIWVWTNVTDPYYGWNKVTSTDEIQTNELSYAIVSDEAERQLGNSPDYEGHIYGYEYEDLSLGADNSFYSPESGYYCIQLSNDYMTWTEEDGLSLEYFDPWMDYPENKFMWSISFDDSGNALIKPFSNDSYYLSWNDSGEYFECVTSGGNPVQIYQLNDGTLPSPTFSPDSFWFMDGETLDVTLSPADGTVLHYGINGEPDTYATDPVSLTISETTSVSLQSELSCSSTDVSATVSHTYYKVNDIEDVRTSVENGIYSIHGIVTFSEANHLFLQDETGGIHIQRPTDPYNYLYYTTNTTGNEMILTGTSINTTAGISFDCAANEALHEDLSDGNTVQPIEVTFAELNNGSHIYQSMLVKVSSVTVGAHVGSFGNGYYPLTQGNQTLRLRDTYEGEYSFSLTQGSIIDVTAIFVEGDAWNCDLIIRDDDEDIFVKNSHDATLEAYSDVTLTTPNTAWNSNIVFCDAEGNTVSTTSYHTGSQVYFTFADGFGAGLNNYYLPVAAVCDAFTGEVIYDSYNNFQLMASELDNFPSRLFTFVMPDADVTIMVYLQTEIHLSVAGYGNSENAKWTLIASPVVESNAPATVDNLFGSEFDLYRFGTAASGEWQNYKTDNFNLANGQGYLYASEEDATLVFKGIVFNGDSKTVNLVYNTETTDADHAGWNLVGNPFPCEAYIDREYYVLNEDGTGFDPVAKPRTTPIPPCTAVLVKAAAQGETVVFTLTDNSKNKE